MKFEKYKDIQFKFSSKMKGVDEYSKKFRIYRRTPRLSTQIISTKSGLTGGLKPISRTEELLIDTIGTLSVLADPLDGLGQPTGDASWIDEVMDNEILFALYSEVIAYQNSFYQDDGGQEDVGDQA